MLANAVLACLVFLKKSPPLPRECGFPRRRLGGLFPFPKPQCHQCWWLLLLCKVTALSPSCQTPPRSAWLGLWPGTCSRLPGCHLACLVYFCFNSFSFLRTFSRLGNSIGGCPQWPGCQQGALPARSWQGENWTLPLQLPMDLEPPARPGHCCNGTDSMGCLCLPISPRKRSQDSCFFSNLAIPVNDSSHQLRDTG